MTSWHKIMMTFIYLLLLTVIHIIDPGTHRMAAMTVKKWVGASVENQTTGDPWCCYIWCAMDPINKKTLFVSIYTSTMDPMGYGQEEMKSMIFSYRNKNPMIL